MSQHPIASATSRSDDVISQTLDVWKCFLACRGGDSGGGGGFIGQCWYINIPFPLGCGWVFGVWKVHSRTMSPPDFGTPLL